MVINNSAYDNYLNEFPISVTDLILEGFESQLRLVLESYLTLLSRELIIVQIPEISLYIINFMALECKYC